MNQYPKISLVIPAYRSDYFSDCLESAVEQDYKNKEIIICDDSRDEAITRITSYYVSKYPDAVIRYYKNEERLLEHGNISRCILEAKGDYIKPLFDDDLLVEDCCSKMVKMMEDNPSASLGACRRSVINSTDGKVEMLHAYNYPFMGKVLLAGKDTIGFLRNNIVNFIGEPSCVIFRREDVLPMVKEGIYKLGGEDIYWISDLTLYVKLLAQGDLAMTPENLAYFRVSEGQTSRGILQHQEVIRESYQKFPKKIEALFPGLRTDGMVYCSINACELNLSNLIREKFLIAERKYLYKWESNCRFSIYIQQELPSDEKKNETTIASINNQYGLGAKIYHNAKDCYKNASATPEDWTLFVCSGDWLPEHALIALSSGMKEQNTGEKAVFVYFDHCEIDSQGAGSYFHKPGYSPELLQSMPYTGRCVAVKNEWLIENYHEENISSDLVQTHAYALKAFSQGKEKVIHIPEVLAYLDASNSHFFIRDEKNWEAIYQVLQRQLQEDGKGYVAATGPYCGTFHVIPPLLSQPLVSIIIPTKDQLDFLSRCIETLLEKTSYKNYEIIVVNNESRKNETIQFLDGICGIEGLRIKVIDYKGGFNFSKMNNLAAREAQGDYLLLLNNDTAIVQGDWLANMVRHALQKDVGVVGARLIYPEGTLQHAGVFLGLRGPAEHPCLGLPLEEPGYAFRAQLTQNFSAVTAACMLVSKQDYFSVGGLDEKDFAVSYNDIDFCLKIHQLGKRIVWTPLATLIHEGSASQKASIEEMSKDNKIARFRKEQQAMYSKWKNYIADDPAYNPNLTLVERGYEIETNDLLRFSPRKGWSEKERVVAFPADSTGCGHYRIIQPLEAMIKAELCSGGISGEIFTPNLALRSGAKTFVFQRPNTEFMLENLKSLSILKDIKKIFEIDDNLIQVPLKNDHYHHIPRDLRGKLIKAIGLCDRLVVSTEPLADLLKQHSSDIRVVPNRLPTSLWGETPPRRLSIEERRKINPKPVVGWAGGISHRGDLEMIASVIKELHQEVDWVFLGMCPDSIRPYIKEFYPGVPTLQYPQQLQLLAKNWDLAIAPVEINPFNECKSNLKQLEIGWCGVPMVCSDAIPYQSGLPVTLVRNRHRDWVNAVREKISSPEELQAEGLELQSAVVRDWLLSDLHLRNWLEAWTG